MASSLPLPGLILGGQRNFGYLEPGSVEGAAQSDFPVTFPPTDALAQTYSHTKDFLVLKILLQESTIGFESEKQNLFFISIFSCPHQ